MAHLRKTVPVSGKNDSVCPNSVLLLPERPATFGRIISPDTNVRLLSKVTPLMISRRHATISVSAGKWRIIDHEVQIINIEDLFFPRLVKALIFLFKNNEALCVF